MKICDVLVLQARLKMPKCRPKIDEEVDSVALIQCPAQSSGVIISDTESFGTFVQMIAHSCSISRIGLSNQRGYTNVPSRIALAVGQTALYPKVPLSLPAHIGAASAR
jgi:hypothetical protein